MFICSKYFNWILLLFLFSCKEKKVNEAVYQYQPTKIIPADCSEEDSIKYVQELKQREKAEVESKKLTIVKTAQGMNAKNTLDSLAKDVDKYIDLRNKSTDSVTWLRWEDSVKQHIVNGQILMNQKVDRLQEVDNAREFREGFKVKPKKNK